jgi:hypothetical protein
LTSLTARLDLLAAEDTTSAYLQFFSEFTHLRFIWLRVKVPVSDVTTGQPAFTFYKELLFRMLDNCRKLRVVNVRAVGIHKDSSISSVIQPVLKLQTNEYPEFLRLISNVENLDTLAAIGGDVPTFCATVARDNSGIVTNLKSLNLAETFRGTDDLRLALLKLCPNIEKLDLCVDVGQLNLVNFRGDCVASDVNLTDIIHSQVSPETRDDL